VKYDEEKFFFVTSFALKPDLFVFLCNDIQLIKSVKNKRLETVCSGYVFFK